MQHRANAIPESLESVTGFPFTLKIYRIPASRFWYVRCWMSNRMVSKSLKTEIKSEAVKGAKAFYNDLVLRRAKNEPLTSSPTFELVANDLFKEDQRRVDRGERAQSLVDDAEYIFKADLIKFFNRTHVKDVTYQKLSDYITYLKASREELNRPMLGSKTLKNHFILISKILKHANKLGYIDRLPIFPTIQVKDNPREWLSDDQYDLLITKTKEQIALGTVLRGVRVTENLLYLIEFTVNSFLRPPDIKTLRHRQVTTVKNYLRIMAVAKVSAKQVVTMPKAAEVYTHLKGKPDDFVFFPQFANRDYAAQVMNRQFNHVLLLAGLKKGPLGRPRTLYSLRHTCVMNTLLRARNINLLVLAKNCRTSVDMIERFYASHLTAEMNIHQFQDQTTPQEIYTIFDAEYAAEQGEKEKAKRS